MPLCTLEIPRAQFDAMSIETRDNAAYTVCGLALLTILDKLQIPNKDDKEIRLIVRDDILESRMSIAFTVGDHEYDDYPKPEFHPTDEQIHEAGTLIQKDANHTEFRIAETTIESWANTTWKQRNIEAPEPQAPENYEPLRQEGRFAENPTIRLVLPEARYGAVSSGGEEEIGKENPHKKVTEEIYCLVAETLGIAKEKVGIAELIIVYKADADFSLEFDCRMAEGHQLPEVLRKYAADRVEQYLNANPVTKEGTAEVWIRQGEPTTAVFS